MQSNLIVLICRLLLMAAAPIADAAVYETANFSVEAYDAELARDVAERAEACRAEQWQLWGGSAALPDWAYKCEVTIRIGRNTLTGGGSTSMAFEAGEVFGFQGTWEGTREQLLTCVVPHEVSHTVIATRFRQAIPRCLDEGIATSFEAGLGRNVWREEVRNVLTQGRGIGLNELFAMTEYPRDFRALYAQGSSLVEFLLEMDQPPALMKFVEGGLERDWHQAARAAYGFEDLAHLQESWIAWIRKGGGRVTAGKPYTASQCQIMPDGSMVCPQSGGCASGNCAQGGMQILPAGRRFQFVEPAPQRPQREPLLPKTFAGGGAGVAVSGPRGTGMTIGAVAPPAQTVASACQCGPRLEAIEKNLADINARIGTLANRNELASYATREQLEQHTPDLTGLATVGQVKTVEEAVEKSHTTLLEKIGGAVTKAKAVGEIAIAAKEAAAAGSGGLFAGAGFGMQLATLLGISGGPAGLLALGGFIAYRRLSKRLRAGGRVRPRPFRKEA